MDTHTKRGLLHSNSRFLKSQAPPPGHCRVKLTRYLSAAEIAKVVAESRYEALLDLFDLDTFEVQVQAKWPPIWANEINIRQTI